MTEKRGTGADYGQEILRERSAEADTPEPTKKVSKKTVLSVIVAAIIAGGAMTAVILTSDKTPAEKVEALSVDISNDGIALTENVKADIENSGTQTSEPALTNAEAVKTDSENAPETPALEIAQLKKNSLPETETPVEVEAVEPVKPTAEVLPAEDIVKGAQSAPEATNNEREYDPAKFGITEDKSPDADFATSQGSDVKTASVADPASVAPAQTDRPESLPEANPVSTPAPEPIRLERVELPATNQFAQPLTMTGSDLNYTGSALKVEYKAQQQDTVYLYSTFAAKIFLLPTDKGENINAYLSDEKGWQLKLLPGGILRVQRSDNKASWSQATDLFIVAGKRTYSLILQGVGEPGQRTDSLRYTSAEPEQKPKSKK
ncbi:hypothetical protein [Providencia sp. PROV255]|uniref:hypothetical protein n=1 Tax=Providencia sp. PROV255 TaxID=2949943 RepID=UPI002349F879|nr:hypothetical protein [Providencia sp. PROV255]